MRDLFLSEKEWNEVAQEIIKGNKIPCNTMEMFLSDTETKRTKEIINKYSLNEKEVADFENIISYYQYLDNDGTIFNDLSICFIDENEKEFIPSGNTILAFAEYIVMVNQIYTQICDNQALKIAENILKGV